MHEVSLVHALFDQADRALAPHPSATAVQLTVRIGELAGVDTELFRTAFEGCRVGRGYERAALTITAEPATWACATCGARGPRIAGDEELRCPTCDGELRLVAGGGLFLDRVELEVADV